MFIYAVGIGCLLRAGDNAVLRFISAWKNGRRDYDLIREAVRLYVKEAHEIGCVIDAEVITYIANRIKTIAAVHKVDLEEWVVEKALSDVVRDISKATRLTTPQKEIRLDGDVYLLLTTFVESGDCAALRRAVEKVGARQAAILLRSWGFDEVCDEELNRMLREIKPEESADLKLVIDDNAVSAPGATALNTLSRGAIYMPVGMAFADPEKWRVFHAVSAFYHSLKAYPIYLVEYQWQNWRRLTSYDVTIFEGYAVDMAAEGIGEGCGVAYKRYSPSVFAHELIHCAQQAEGRVRDAGSMELEAHAVEKLVLLYLDGDEIAKKIAELAGGKLGLYLQALTEEDIVKAFATRGVDIRALGYVVEGFSLLAKPGWVQYYRSLGDLPRQLTIFHNLVYFYANNRSPLAAYVLLQLFRRSVDKPRRRHAVDLGRDAAFLREYAYFSEQYQRGRLSAAHLISLVWLGFNKAYGALGDVEEAKRYVASTLAGKLKYTATSIDIDGRAFMPPEVVDIVKLIPQIKRVEITERYTVGSTLRKRELECNAEKAFYEASNFAGEYRRNPRGFEDWQIATRIAVIVREFLDAGCRKDRVVEYLAKFLDELGIKRDSIKTAYLHGTRPEVAEVLLYLFPNLAWKVPEKTATRVTPVRAESFPQIERISRMEQSGSEKQVEGKVETSLPTARKIRIMLVGEKYVPIEDIRREVVGRILTKGQQLVLGNRFETPLVVLDVQPPPQSYVTNETEIEILQEAYASQSAETKLRARSPQDKGVVSTSQALRTSEGLSRGSDSSSPLRYLIGDLIRSVGFLVLFFAFVSALLKLKPSYGDVVLVEMGYSIVALIAPIYFLALRKDDIAIKSVTAGVAGLLIILVAHNLAEGHITRVLGLDYVLILFAIVWLVTWATLWAQHWLEDWRTASVVKTGITLAIIGIGYLMLALFLITNFVKRLS